MGLAAPLHTAAFWKKAALDKMDGVAINRVGVNEADIDTNETNDDSATAMPAVNGAAICDQALDVRFSDAWFSD